MNDELLQEQAKAEIVVSNYKMSLRLKGDH